MLKADLQLARGAFTVDVSLELPAGVSAVFGRSGSGKTTVLRCIAGLDRAPNGFVQLGNDVWQAPDGRFVPTHLRGTGYIFQENQLLPHLAVLEHLRYAEKRALRKTFSIDEVVQLLGLVQLTARRTRTLSGGERQRVAIASALLSGPALLLMDEPLSSLDEVERNELLPYLEAVAQRLAIPVIYVSHSLREVARLADYVVWLDQGRVRDRGSPEEVFSNLEFARWRRDDAGTVAKVQVKTHDAEYNLTTVSSPWGELSLAGCPAQPGKHVRIRILASDVSIARARDPNTTIMNQLPVRIAELRESEADVLVRMVPHEADSPALLARITRLSRDRLELAPGTQAYAWIKAVAVLQ